MRNGLTAIDGWSAVRKHVVSVSLNVFAHLMVQNVSNLLKYAAVYVRLMSDDIVLNDSAQGYAGSGTLPFASRALAQAHAGMSSVGYIGDGLNESTLFELEQTINTILNAARNRREMETERVVMYSKALNSLCRSVLEKAEERIGSLSTTRPTEPGIEVKHSSLLRSVSEVRFPYGPALSQDNWSSLCSLLMKRLDRYGCIITQRDRRFLSEASGIDVSPYIWSTLVKRLDLRRVKNPYSASSLVIYVPRLKK